MKQYVVDFPKYKKEHMHYVALSRVRNSSALHVLHLNENKIKVSEKVKKEMKRLRTHATMVPLAVLGNTNLQELCIYHLVSKCKISSPSYR